MLKIVNYKLLYLDHSFSFVKKASRFEKQGMLVSDETKMNECRLRRHGMVGLMSRTSLSAVLIKIKCRRVRKINEQVIWLTFTKGSSTLRSITRYSSFLGWWYLKVILGSTVRYSTFITLPPLRITNQRWHGGIFEKGLVGEAWYKCPPVVRGWK